MLSEQLTVLAIGLAVLGAFIAGLAALALMIKAGKNDGPRMVILILLIAIIGIPVFAYRRWEIAKPAVMTWLAGLGLIVFAIALFIYADSLTIGELEAALAATPDDPIINDRLAAEYFRESRYEEALPLMQKALKLQATKCKDAKTYCEFMVSELRIVETYNKLGRYQEAIQAWQTYAPKRAFLSHYDIEAYGEALHGAGRFPEASRVFLEFCEKRMLDLCEKHRDQILPASLKNFCDSAPWNSAQTLWLREQKLQGEHLCKDVK